MQWEVPGLSKYLSAEDLLRPHRDRQVASIHVHMEHDLDADAEDRKPTRDSLIMPSRVAVTTHQYRNTTRETPYVRQPLTHQKS